MLSHVQLFVAPWTVACQSPLPMEFSGKNTVVGCYFPLQSINFSIKNYILFDYQTYT